MSHVVSFFDLMVCLIDFWGWGGGGGGGMGCTNNAFAISARHNNCEGGGGGGFTPFPLY